MRYFHHAALLCVSVILVSNVLAQSQSVSLPTDECDSGPYHKLDFWIGSWDVFDKQSGEKAGTNRIEKTPNGCAIREIWRDASDNTEITGFVYYVPAARVWKYVLVDASGNVKERVSVEDPEKGGIRFQGTIPHIKDAGSHLDRMTLVVVSRDVLRETVEFSRDEGKTWQASFDGEYRRQK